jgi:hypothetical protein
VVVAGGGAVEVIGGVWVVYQIMPSTKATATAIRIVRWSMAFPVLQRPFVVGAARNVPQFAMARRYSDA